MNDSTAKPLPPNEPDDNPLVIEVITLRDLLAWGGRFFKGFWIARGLPLLTKELLEQAQQRSTYINRVLFCLILYIAVLGMELPSMLNAKSPYELLGRGHGIFLTTAWTQSLMIVIFMPILACGVVAHEKERNTLQLLILTRLSPQTIILEKFLSRIITMGSYLLSSLPLLVIAYPLGGVTEKTLIYFILSQVMALFWIGSITVACSTWCATPSASLLLTYLILGTTTICACPCISPLSMLLDRNFSQMAGSRHLEFWFISIPPLIQSMGMLWFAQTVLIRRATIPPTNLMLKVFQALDAWFKQMNDNSVTRGVELIKSRQTLPEDTPVAWREKTRTVVGSATHLVRLFLLFTVPLGIYLDAALSQVSRWNQNDWARFFLIIWAPAIFTVLISSAGLIPGEYSRQTMDVLLSTPLKSRDILLQKRKGVQRLIGVFFLIFLFLSSVKLYIQPGTSLLATLVLGAWLLAVFWIDLSFVSWLAVAVSLSQKKILRTLILSSLLLPCWLGWGLVLNSPLVQDSLAEYETVTVQQSDRGNASTPQAGQASSEQVSTYTVRRQIPLEKNLVIQTLFVMSPLGAIAPGAVVEEWEFDILRFPFPWIANLVLHGVMLWLLKGYCVKIFSRKLGRLDPQRIHPPEGTPA